MGAEILTPGVSTGRPGAAGAGAGAADLGAGTANPSGGLKAVGPENATPLPPIEKAGPAPDQVNDIAPGTKQAAAQAPPANGKKAKPGFDKGDESSSKHKKKKGLNKLNPL